MTPWSSKELAEWHPFIIVLRWGAELPKPEPKPADADWPSLSLAIAATFYTEGCALITAAGVDLTDKMRAGVLAAALRAAAPDAIAEALS